MKPVYLRCEHAVEPLCVESLRPLLSWTDRSTDRGARQSACQVICARSLESVMRERGDEWDSGRVEGRGEMSVRYAGAPLSGFTRYYFRVRVWDGRGETGGWSEPGSFETGALSASDWKASWITRTDARYTSSMVFKVDGTLNKHAETESRLYWGMYFVKTFRVTGQVIRARAYASGLGYYELSINDRKVGDHLLDPGQTDYRSHALYAGYRIEDHLQAGENTVTLALGNGRHIDVYGYGVPKGFVQLLLEYADGSTETVVSDESWRFTAGPVHENGIYQGEIYDARDEEMLLAAARMHGAPGDDRAELTEPAALSAQIMPPIRATRRFRAVAFTNPAQGVYVYDLGQNFAGLARLRVNGPRGTQVKMRFSELLGPDGMLHFGTNRRAIASDTYILKGEGPEEYLPRFTYHGFRFVELTGFPGIPDFDSIEGVAVHTDVRQGGAFACSDPLVNRIHENVLWSQRANLMSLPTDCPQREERMGWLGDAQLASEQAMYNFDMAAFYVKFLEDIRVSQKEDGSISDVTPPYWPLYPADPAWGSAYVTLAWNMYAFYGDTAMMERHYDGMKRYVDFLHSKSDSHIIRTLGKYGDWCPPGSIFPKQTPIELTSTWYYYHDTLHFARIAGILGRSADEGAYTKRAGEILEAFNAEFLREGQYATLKMSPVDRTPGQTSQTLPLYLGMVPEDQRQAAVEKLVEVITTKFDSHVDTGIVGTRYIFEVLRDAGHAELAWAMITQKEYPGWGYMIDRGATTIWERWEELRGKGMNSHNHIMLGTVDAWFYRTIGGIIPTAPGFRTVLIAPHAPGRLTHAAATVLTVNGEITVSWRKEGGSFVLEVEVPVGTTAEVRIPRTGKPDRLFEGEVEIAGAALIPGAIRAGAAANVHEPGIQSVRAGNDRYVLTVGSGRYLFTRRPSDREEA